MFNYNAFEQKIEDYQKFCVWDLILGDEEWLLETKLHGNLSKWSWCKWRNALDVNEEMHLW